MDGETALNIKTIQSSIIEILNKDAKKNLLELNENVKIEYDLPNCLLYQFQGKLIFQNQEIPLNNDNIVLRGCKLKNTNSITGLVLYTGHKTKIMLNNISN